MVSKRDTDTIDITSIIRIIKIIKTAKRRDVLTSTEEEMRRKVSAQNKAKSRKMLEVSSRPMNFFS